MIELLTYTHVKKFSVAILIFLLMVSSFSVGLPIIGKAHENTEADNESTELGQGVCAEGDCLFKNEQNEKQKFVNKTELDKTSETVVESMDDQKTEDMVTVVEDTNLENDVDDINIENLQRWAQELKLREEKLEKREQELKKENKLATDIVCNKTKWEQFKSIGDNLTWKDFVSRPKNALSKLSKSKPLKGPYIFSTTVELIPRLGMCLFVKKGRIFTCIDAASKAVQLSFRIFVGG